MYKVKFYKGDYRHRQEKANNDGCIAYVEHHFNSAGSNADYTMVIVGSNASATSKNWGRFYAQAVSSEFHVPLQGGTGFVVGGFNGRGDSSLRFTNMPAILLEPLFASNPQHAKWIRSESGQTRLARILCESIQRFFPDGGTIAFSVGHKYKKSKPNDRGASVVGGGNEADFAEKVLKKAKTMLEGITDLPQGREVIVSSGGKILFKTAVDDDAEITWNPTRGVLEIEQA